MRVYVPRISFTVLAPALVLLGLLQTAQAIDVYPAAIQLDNAKDVERLVVVHTREDGVTLDVSKTATVTIEPAGLAEVDDERRVRPIADGEGTITIAHEGGQATVPLKVLNAAVTPPVSFRNDVEPAIMRAGCNTGACHGSARGQNGFRLTLFGYDANIDYSNLTRQLSARRLNTAAPEESLMLLKPLGEVDHEGGAVMEKDSALYGTLFQWIKEGAASDPTEPPKVTGIEILPRQCVLEGAEAAQQFIVRATYSDGTDRDVTELAVLSTSDDQTVLMDKRGQATAVDRGEAYLMARYGTFAQVAQVMVVPSDMKLEWPDVTPRNYIDEAIFAKLKNLRVPPAELASDTVFLRRAYLDILGVLPTLEETQAFFADTAENKREILIDQLLERPEFADLWAMKWAEVLQIRSTASQSPKGMYRYNDWLRQAIAENKPIGEWVTELLTASGGNFSSPAANFYLTDASPTLMAENVAQVFMGIRVQCAQCHNHPFERWTMDDYYSFASFFSQVGRKNSTDPREQIIFNRGSGEVTNIRTNQPAVPKFLGGDVPDLQGRDRREALAEWLTAPENPWFAKNVANRVWQNFLGKGIIEPVDDVRVSNPPSHPDLLDTLGAKLVEYEFDLKRLIRDIANSYTYQQGTQPRDPNLRDERNFAFAPIRRLPSEQLLDAISQVTDSSVKFAALPQGARAAEVANGDAGNYFLKVFGRPLRDSACTCERRNEPTLAQTLHLINGSTIEQAIKTGDGALAKALAAEKPIAEVVNDLYLAAYCRPPTDVERQAVEQYVSESENLQLAMEDVYWSVLNSKEFVFNH